MVVGYTASSFFLQTFAMNFDHCYDRSNLNAKLFEKIRLFPSASE